MYSHQYKLLIHSIFGSSSKEGKNKNPEVYSVSQLGDAGATALLRLASWTGNDASIQCQRWNYPFSKIIEQTEFWQL